MTVKDLFEPLFSSLNLLSDRSLTKRLSDRKCRNWNVTLRLTTYLRSYAGTFKLLALTVILAGQPMTKSFGQSDAEVTKAPGTSSLQAWERISDQQAWQILPEVREGKQSRLPNWVKAVALQMPRTAAAMLELDLAQRTQGPLDAALKARLRWVISHANRCAYGEAEAKGDLQRADRSSPDPEQVLADPTQWPSDQADAFQFVRLLSTEAPNIPDKLFESLRDKYGERGVAAIVLLTAYANFHDRLLLGLQVPLEDGGPLPPVNVRFAESALQRTPILHRIMGKQSITPMGKRSHRSITNGHRSATNSCRPAWKVSVFANLACPFLRGMKSRLSCQQRWRCVLPAFAGAW